MKIKRWEEDLLFSSDLFIKSSKFFSSGYIKHKEKKKLNSYITTSQLRLKDALKHMIIPKRQ